MHPQLPYHAAYCSTSMTVICCVCNCSGGDVAQTSTAFQLIHQNHGILKTVSFVHVVNIHLDFIAGNTAVYFRMIPSQITLGGSKKCCIAELARHCNDPRLQTPFSDYSDVI